MTAATVRAVPLTPEQRQALADAREAVEGATAARAALIVALAAEGASLREIAEVVGVSHQTVANIIARSR